MEKERLTNGRAVEIETRIRDAMRITFARSGGAGGQNVNKVNTKVVAALALAGSGIFTEPELERLNERLGNRINAEGELVVHAQEERSQSMNREAAEARIVRLVLGALRPVKQRRPTRPGRAAREERLREKRLRSEKKRARNVDHEY
jgi:ribosome-associated protein